MARVVVSRRVPVPRDELWEALADLQSHVEWMRDARSIEFTDDRRRGTGTRMRVLTVIGPLRTNDIMEVVGWEEGEAIEVRHEGVVTGQGRFELATEDGATVVTWTESLRFPWWLGGEITAWLARPVLAAVWRGNLRRLEALLTG